MTITRLDDTNTAGVTSSGDHAQVTSVEFDVVGDISGFNVDDDGIVDLDVWVGVSDGSCVMSDNEWNSLLCNTDLGDLAEFVSCLLGGNSVNGESTFDVVDKTESFVSFFDGDDIHETGWEGAVTSNFTVNFDQVLLQNFLHFIPGKGIMETISEEDDQWEALPLLVWTLGWLGCENSSEFVEHPVRWSIQALQMLLLSASHFL